jgi:hypothetical protein
MYSQEQEHLNRLLMPVLMPVLKQEPRQEQKPPQLLPELERTYSQDSNGFSRQDNQGMVLEMC